MKALMSTSHTPDAIINIEDLRIFIHTTLCAKENLLEEQFPQIIEVLKTQNKHLARQILISEKEIGKLSDHIVDEMILDNDKSLSKSDAVSLAMYARYLKRINAHLSNIASSMVNPFPRIGFREKKK